MWCRALQLTVFTFAAFLYVHIVLAQDDKSVRRLENFLYSDLQHVQSFGYIYAHVEGSDTSKNTSDEIGLNDSDMTNFLRLRFKNNFAGIPFKENFAWSEPDSEKLKIGNLWCRIWTVGKDYPVAYFVECTCGTLKNSRVLTDGVLGYASKAQAIEAIRRQIDRMVSEFAQTFFRVRGDI